MLIFQISDLTQEIGTRGTGTNEVVRIGIEMTGFEMIEIGMRDSERMYVTEGDLFPDRDQDPLSPDPSLVIVVEPDPPPDPPLTRHPSSDEAHGVENVSGPDVPMKKSNPK